MRSRQAPVTSPPPPLMWSSTLVTERRVGKREPESRASLLCLWRQVVASGPSIYAKGLVSLTVGNCRGADLGQVLMHFHCLGSGRKRAESSIPHGRALLLCGLADHAAGGCVDRPWDHEAGQIQLRPQQCVESWNGVRQNNSVRYAFYPAEPTTITRVTTIQPRPDRFGVARTGSSDWRYRFPNPQ